MNPFGQQFSPEEEEEFGEMARSDSFYEKFAQSVAPSIYGSLGRAYFRSCDCSYSSLSRYQKGHHLFVIWRLQETITRWHALARRY